MLFLISLKLMKKNILLKGKMPSFCLAPNDEKIITHISNFRKVKRIPDVVKTFILIQKSILQN